MRVITVIGLIVSIICSLNTQMRHVKISDHDTLNAIYYQILFRPFLVSTVSPLLLF